MTIFFVATPEGSASGRLSFLDGRSARVLGPRAPSMSLARRVRPLAVATLVASVLASTLVPASARTFSQVAPAEHAVISQARAAVRARCDCQGAGRRGAYLRCVAQALRSEVAS